ncbi:hypothetical protein BH09MYX1_BH09MYX1_26930 [soil metagenome]
MQNTHRFVWAALVLASSFLASSAGAQGPSQLPPGAAASAPADGPDAVVLKDGTTLRGTLVEIQQSVSVRLQMADGKVATVRWEVIERVDQAPRAPVVRQPPPVAPSSPSSATALVHIDVDSPVILEQMNGQWDGDEWHAVCEAPCDIPLPLGPSYRIAGDGTRKSKPFVLNGQTGRVTLDVRRASTGAFGGGLALVITGPIVLLVGLVVTFFGIAENQSSDYCISAGACSTHNGTSLIATGLILLGAGTVGTIIGGILLGGNSRTKVGQFGAPVAAPATGTDLTRRPIWNAERSATPTTPWTLPIIRATF